MSAEEAGKKARQEEVVKKPAKTETEDLLKRSESERARIVNNYRKGRHAGVTVEPWEDPSFELYHTTDRHGFIHDSRLPPKVDSEKHQIQVEMERVKKWLKMLRNWDSMATTEKFRRRLFKGIPNSLRGQVWKQLLRLDTVKEEQKGKYQEMLQYAYEMSPDIRQIDLDVNRTYRDHIMFRERYSKEQLALFNILSAFSMYNMEIGYCQGMSQVAALLLMYLSEEDAFWALALLTGDKKYAMHGFFIIGFPKLIRFQEHHNKVLNRFLPKVKRHMEKWGMDTGIYTLKWFFQCFLDRVPFTLALRVWDVYFYIGEKVLIGMAYTILKMHRRTILNIVCMDTLNKYINEKLERDFGYDDDVVMVNLEQNLNELKRAKLDNPGPPPSNELPTRPFGVIADVPVDVKIGRRSDKFSAAEEATKESAMLRREEAEREAKSRISIEESGLSGSKFSFDPSIDDTSSLLDHHGGSRRSLADTSVTSTADLSVFSTATRSQALDNSLDTHSNASDGSGSGGSGVGHPASIQRGPSAHSTPRATPHAPSPDVVRIYVPYTSSSPTPTASPQNGEVPRSLPRPLNDQNKIRIHIDNQEEQTPIVEHGQLIKPFRIDSPEIDLK